MRLRIEFGSGAVSEARAGGEAVFNDDAHLVARIDLDVKEAEPRVSAFLYRFYLGCRSEGERWLARWPQAPHIDAFARVYNEMTA